jgi:hypothetical protein
MRRADNYKNIFDSKVDLMHGRNADGSWHKPFHPHKYVFKGPITEGANWKYSWYVPQDVQGLAHKTRNVMGKPRDKQIADPIKRKLKIIYYTSGRQTDGQPAAGFIDTYAGEVSHDG